MIFVIGLWTFLRVLLFGAAAVALENLALRHQLLVLQRSVRRPRLTRWDRVLWVWLSRVWARWRSGLVIVQPATVLAWHRKGFQLYWRWKSRAQPGRPPETRRGAARADPTHGAGESDVGPPAHSGRADPARLRGRRTDRRQVHAPDVSSAVASLHHSERGPFCRVLRDISPTTTPRGHTNRLTTTVPSHESSNPPHVAGSSPSLRSAAFITATLASPDRGRPAGQPSPTRAIHPDWNGQSALQSSAAIHATIPITLNTTRFRTFAASVRRSQRLADEVSDRHKGHDAHSARGQSAACPSQPPPVQRSAARRQLPSR